MLIYWIVGQIFWKLSEKHHLLFFFPPRASSRCNWIIWESADKIHILNVCMFQSRGESIKLEYQCLALSFFFVSLFLPSFLPSENSLFGNISIFRFIFAKNNVRPPHKNFLSSHYKTTLENDSFTLSKNLTTRTPVVFFLKFICLKYRSPISSGNFVRITDIYMAAT